MIAGDPVEGLAVERVTRGDVELQIRDAERLLDFGRPRHLQQDVGDVDADDSGATACEFPSDPAMTAGEIEDAHPANPSEEVEQRDTRCLAADFRADPTDVEVADPVVAGRRAWHARHHRIRAQQSNTGWWPGWLRTSGRGALEGAPS